MTRASRVLISGYYGFANAGDEAILAGLVAGFRQLAPSLELTVLSGNPAATASEHGVRASRRGLLSARTQLRSADLLISGGGGLLQDATSWRSPLYYLAVLRLAGRGRCRTACLAHGIGPLRRKWIRALARGTLSQVDLLTVRDRRSAEALGELGVTRPAEVTADLAFLLPAPAKDEVIAAREKADLPPSNGPQLGLALRRPPGPPRRGLAAFLARGIGAASLEVGLRPVFVPMQRPRDLDFAAEVAAQLPLPSDTISAPLATRELLALLGGFDVVVAMRLHALIFAALCGRPPVAISYDPKVDGLMEELGLRPAAHTDRLNPDDLSGAVLAAWQERARLAAALAPHVARLRAAALRNIRLALALLGG
jgi:polysaccharide pyruvyl transferase CsaB